MKHENPYDGQQRQAWTLASLAGEPTLGLFQKVLLTTDGTVTELLALHAQREIRAHKVAQTLTTGSAPSILAASADERILHRTITLGAADGPVLLFADSWFVFDRFPATIQRDLLETDLPIGLLWRRDRLEMVREILSIRSEHCRGAAALLGIAPETLLYARTYCIIHQGRPLGVITEKFSATAFG